MSSLLSVDRHDLDEAPIERLEAEITGFAARLASATAQWLLWVAAYDRRRGWESWELRSCSAWLSWHCGISPRTARQHVAVAHKVAEFPRLRASFVAGELSYSKVRAIARVVCADNEDQLVDVARYATASQLDQICGKLPATDRELSGNVKPRAAGVGYKDNLDGTGTISITVPIDDMVSAEAAIEATASSIIEESSSPECSRRETIDSLGGMQQINAGVAVGLLTGTTEAKSSSPAEVLLVVDEKSLSGESVGESHVGGRNISHAGASRLACDSVVQTLAVDAGGEPLSMGRRTRVVSQAIRRALNRRDDGMCRFPGCSSKRRLHAHHVEHWSKGGETSLNNLISLCHFHHHSVHEGGWGIESSPEGWRFKDTNNVVQFPKTVPRGRLAETIPMLPGSKRDNGTNTLPLLAGTGQHCDTDYVADVLMTSTS